MAVRKCFVILIPVTHPNSLRKDNPTTHDPAEQTPAVDGLSDRREQLTCSLACARSHRVMDPDRRFIEGTKVDM
jgi:hypothetical protein